MGSLDELAMAMAIGLPIVLVSAGGVFLALSGEPPAPPPREAGGAPATEETGAGAPAATALPR